MRKKKRLRETEGTYPNSSIQPGVDIPRAISLMLRPNFPPHAKPASQGENRQSTQEKLVVGNIKEKLILTLGIKSGANPH